MLQKPCDSRLVLQRPCLALLLAVVIAPLGVARPQERASDEVMRERRAFIEAATEEQMERLREAEQEMHRRGVAPMMIIATLKPFADWDYFYVEGGSIRWSPNAGQHYEPVEVPRGFVTDLASIPRAFWQVLRPEGRHAYAAVVHDYLYWTQKRPREEADLIFKFALQDSRVSSDTVETLYRAVRLFGQSAWESNAKLREAGECRLLKRPPDDFTVTWGEWKKQPGIC